MQSCPKIGFKRRWIFSRLVCRVDISLLIFIRFVEVYNVFFKNHDFIFVFIGNVYCFSFLLFGVERIFGKCFVLFIRLVKVVAKAEIGWGPAWNCSISLLLYFIDITWESLYRCDRRILCILPFDRSSDGELWLPLVKRNFSWIKVLVSCGMFQYIDVWYCQTWLRRSYHSFSKCMYLSYHWLQVVPIIACLDWINWLYHNWFLLKLLRILCIKVMYSIVQKLLLLLFRDKLAELRKRIQAVFRVWASLIDVTVITVDHTERIVLFWQKTILLVCWGQ